MILTILEQIGVAILGIALYNVFMFRDKLRTTEIQYWNFWHALWIESRFIWGWVLSVVVILSIAIAIMPGSGEAITTLTGLDVTNSLVSFFTIGISLSGIVDSKKKN